MTTPVGEWGPFAGHRILWGGQARKRLGDYQRGAIRFYTTLTERRTRHERYPKTLVKLVKNR